MVPESLVLLSLFTFAGMVQAQITPPPPALATVRASPGYRAAIEKTYNGYESSLSTHCASVEIDFSRPPRVLNALTTNEKGEITGGSWQESQDGIACGQHRRYNALVIIRDGKPGVYSQFPGEGYGSPVLERDSMQYVAIATGAGPDCRPEVLDTRLVHGEPTKLANGLDSPWDERWTVRSCGKGYVVTLHFVPDATGTNIHVSPGETVKQ